MKCNNKILLTTLQGKKTDRVPFWFMRQAGRYLPEYKQLRASTKNFLEFCYTPEKATEATMQPIHRFGMDGAIIFSDILVVPHALGMDVRFEEGRGPVLVPVRDGTALAKINNNKFNIILEPVYEALRQTRKALPEETTLIGFAGCPWTLACYVVEGSTSKDFSQVKETAERDGDFFLRLITMLTDAVIEHAGNQIDAGAEVIQLFDSWAGILDDEAYEQWVIAPAKKIIEALKGKYPQIPVIGFPRQSGIKYARYASKTGVDAVSFDTTVPLDWVKNNLQPKVIVQGCLTPETLASSRKDTLAEADNILDALSGGGFVFNLGHGILPTTPVEHMQALCDYLRHTRITQHKKTA